jgi:hypothetical protein
MQPLSFSIVIIPLIAISLSILFYVILLRKTTQKKIFRRYVLTIILVAFVLNALWEILQIPLYVEGVYTWSHVLFCLLASVTDAIMVLLIFFGFGIIYKMRSGSKN